MTFTGTYKYTIFAFLPPRAFFKHTFSLLLSDCILFIQLGIEFYLFVSHGSMKLHTSMRNKQVEFNPYTYTLSKLYRFGYEISVFNTKHPVIILRASLFVDTPSHVASLKIECVNFFLIFIVAENIGSVNIIK